MPVADTRHPLVPAFEISINSAPLPSDARAHVTDIGVDLSVEYPSMFTLNLVSSVELDEEVPWIDDQDLFSIGNVVEIKLGYVDDVETLLIAEITALEPEFAMNQRPTLTVRGYDRLHRLLRGRKTRTYIQQKDSDIASQIASEAGLTAQTEDSGTVHDYVLQANQTDLDFLRQRASRIQYEVVVEDKTLFFRPVGNAQSEVLTISMNDDLLEFSPRLSSVGQATEVSVLGWSPKDKVDLVGQSKSGDEVSTMGGRSGGAALAEEAFGVAVEFLGAYPVATQAEADQLAKARLNQLALELISGDGVCYGRTDLRSGEVIKIEHVGARFSGQYYVTSATHSYSSHDGYKTRFTVRRNAL